MEEREGGREAEGVIEHVQIEINQCRFVIQILVSQKVQSDSREGSFPVRVVWRCVSEEFMEPFVMTTGTMTMQLLSAANWDIKMKVCLY